jgi:hypothetical protein
VTDWHKAMGACAPDPPDCVVCRQNHCRHCRKGTRWHAAGHLIHDATNKSRCADELHTAELIRT